MIKQIIESKGDLSKEQEDMFIASNSNMYYVFDLLGDYYHYKGNGSKALEMWRGFEFRNSNIGAKNRY